MTVAELRALAHRHGYPVAAATLERALAGAAYPEDLRTELERLREVHLRWSGDLAAFNRAVAPRSSGANPRPTGAESPAAPLRRR
jgi:hypothetical protein